MGKTSKDLLQLERKNPSTSTLESSMLVCKTELQRKKTNNEEKKPNTFVPLPQSQVLGKVRDFLGVISEANKRLELDAKENSENYDIEALTGDESQVIEMDLMLGVADLHTPEAIAAAESAVSGYQPVIPLDHSSSELGSEDSIDDDDDEDDEATEFDGKRSSESAKCNDFSGEFRNRKSKKRAKIVEL